MTSELDDIKMNQSLYGSISIDDAAEVVRDESLSEEQKNLALMNVEPYKDQKANYSITELAEKYPAIFASLGTPRDFKITANYQDELKKIEDSLIAHKKQGSFENFWNSFTYNNKALELSDLDAQRMDAIKDGDEEKLADIDRQIYELQQEMDSANKPEDFENFSGTLGTIGASIWRETPALVGTTIATGALAAAAGFTGGTSLAGVAAGATKLATLASRVKKGYNFVRAAKAAKYAGYANEALSLGIIYNDTVNLERGEAYRTLSEERPDLSEEERQQRAWIKGRINGLAEVGTSLVAGLGAQAMRHVIRPAGKAVARQRIMSKLAKDEPANTALKNTLNNMIDSGIITPEMAMSDTFAGKLIAGIERGVNRAEAKGLRFAVDNTIEGYTEIFQDEVGNVIKNWNTEEQGELTTGSTVSAAQQTLNKQFAEIYNYIVNEGDLSEDARNNLKKLGNISLASAFFGGTFAAAGKGIRYLDDRLKTPAAQMENANNTIRQLDNVIEQKKNSEIYGKSKEVANSFFNNAAQNGELPKSVYVEKEKLSALIEEAKNDTVLRAQLDRLNLADKIANSPTDVVEMLFDEFNEVVLDPENPTLYQKIKEDITTNPAMMTKNESVEFLGAILENDPIIKEATQNPDSMYNYIFQNMKKNGADDKLAAANAVLWYNEVNALLKASGSQKTFDQVMKDINLRIEAEEREKGEGIIKKVAKKAKEIVTGESAFVSDQSKLYARAMAENQLAIAQAQLDREIKAGQDTVATESLISRIGEQLDKGVQVKDIHRKFAQAIESKDVEYLTDMLSNTSNKVSRKFFTDLTGIKLPKTKSSVAEALSGWARVDVAEEIGNVLYQSGFVSMKGTLEGNYLDWGKHRGTGEGNEAHGAGIYALKDKDLNKANYYSWMSRQVLKIDGKEYSGGEFNNVISLLDAGRSLEEVIKTYDEALKAMSEKINEIQKDIDDIRKKYPNTQLINEAFYDLESAQELKNTGIFTQEDISRVTAELDSISEKTTMEEKIKARDLRNLEKSRGYFVRLMDELLEVYDVISKGNVSFEKTGAQYEVEIPESKYLLHEEKRFSQQSKFVQKRLNSIMADYGMYSYDRELFNKAWKEFGSTNSLAEMLTWNNLVNILHWSNSGKENIPTLTEELTQSKEYLDSQLNNDEYITNVYDSRDNALKFVEAYKEAIQFASKYKIDDIAKKEGFFEKNDLRGEDIYETLVEKLGSKTDASLALMNEGIKGIEYEGGRDGTGYVIFRGEDIPVRQRLLQDLSGIAGSTTFTPTETIMRLTKISNPTTFAHESFHIFVKNLLDMYNKGFLNPYWKAKTEDIIEFCGFEKDKQGIVVMSGDKYVAAQEKFAEAGTTYLWEGKAPKPHLKAMFDAVAEWFADFYRMLKRTPMGINPKIRKVFDSIFVPYDNQLAVEQNKKLGFLPKPDGMSEEQYEKYKAEKRALTAYSTTEEVKAASRQAKLLAENVYTAEYEESVREAYEDLATDPTYELLERLQREKILKSTLDLPEGLSIRKGFVSEQTGLSAQQIIGEYNSLVKSQEDLARLINDTPSRAAVAKYIAEKHMKAWLEANYPELQDTNSEFASKNERAVRLATMEYMMLAGIDMERFNQVYREIVATAEEFVQKMPMKRAINVERWLEVENKLLQKYEYTKSDKKRADLKREQAILNYLAFRSKDIRTEFYRFAKKRNKFRADPKSSDLRKMDGETWDLLKHILYNYKLTTSKPRSNLTVLEKINRLEVNLLNDGFSSVEELEQYKYILNAGVEDKLIYSDFSLMNNAFGMIENIGYMQKQVIVNDQKLQIEDAADQIVEDFAKKGTKTFAKFGKVSKFMYDEMLMKPTYLKQVLPTRVYLDFVAPLLQGITRKELQIDEWNGLVTNLIKPIESKLSEKFIVNGRTYTGLEMLVIMLNSGNTHNFNCMVRTLQNKFMDENYSANEMIEVLNATPKEFRNTVRGIWQMFEENKEPFQKIQKLIDGKVIKFVEPDAYTFDDGEVMEGGYYPAGKVSQIKDFTDIYATFKVNGVYSSQSFQKDRVGGTHGELDMSLDTLSAWIYKMASVRHVAVPYNNLGKLLRNEKVKTVIGSDMTQSLFEYMQLAVTPDKVDGFLAGVDAFASAQILGWNPMRAFTQVSGIFPAAAHVGPAWVLKALGEINPVQAIKQASGLSEYMYARYKNPEDHLNLYAQSNTLFGTKLQRGVKKAVDLYSNTAMMAVVYGDAIASCVTWKAEFAKRKAEGYSDNDASLLADQAVRETQGDAAAGSRPKILQGNKRFFTKFASYFLGIYSLLAAKGIQRNHWADIGGMLFATVVMGAAWETMWKTLSSWIWADVTDDEKKKKKWEKKGINNWSDLFADEFKQNSLSTLFTSLMPAYGIGGQVGTFFATGKTYKPTNTQLAYLYKGMGALQLTAGYIEEDEKKSRKLKKEGLQNLLELGIVNRDWADTISDWIIGE